ncbi:MAG TPA: bifunctional diaminohydroxyphosphoribosylaminopyrimidine deaminase/5-amino-6-(5-phosphoribosylamino)uracil reductase RibD [Actinomycetota bacterium]|nr:bifunctional diaminohydroxyphosphoribosylaminopyrimidine deaminase/5-amino-6-(5-phosphoribosylamino)uracil reductase RibD [Actinomycetota bacterium]
MGTPSDRYMHRALLLAKRGAGQTSPNPAVGAVVVVGDEIVGSGWHRRAGTDHAEVLALREAGAAAAGATLYVTLEPCSHHGRTPPCVDAVLGAGIRRVVAAMEDPDPRVAGTGIRALRDAGVAVEVGCGGTEAAALNEAYGLHRREGRPFVTYKAALSVDGRTSAADGTSQWITGPEARRDVQRVRARSDAICVGVGTVLADDPSLTVRDARPARTARPPLRVVVDSRGRTPLSAQVLDASAPTLIAVTQAAPAPAVAALQAVGAEVVCLADQAHGDRVPLPALLAYLGRREIVSLLLEGGATLAGSFVAGGLVDRYLFYLAPVLLGAGCPDQGSAGHGAGGPVAAGRGVLEGWTAGTIGAAPRLKVRQVRRVGPDLRVELR